LDDAAMTRFAIATAKDKNMSTDRNALAMEEGNGAWIRTIDTLWVRVVGMGHCLDGPHLGHVVGAEATVTHGRRSPEGRQELRASESPNWRPRSLLLSSSCCRWLSIYALSGRRARSGQAPVRSS
jgi:hypothetical protein